MKPAAVHYAPAGPRKPAKERARRLCRGISADAEPCTCDWVAVTCMACRLAARASAAERRKRSVAAKVARLKGRLDRCDDPAKAERLREILGNAEAFLFEETL